MVITVEEDQTMIRIFESKLLSKLILRNCMILLMNIN